MAPKLPVLSGKEIIKRLNKIGYQVTRQKGSHLRLHNTNPSLYKPLTVPDHKNIKPGLLKAILKQANLSLENFEKLK